MRFEVEVFTRDNDSTRVFVAADDMDKARWAAMEQFEQRMKIEPHSAKVLRRVA